MQLLKERILKDGKVYPGNVLKVSGFLNQLIDEKLLFAVGKEISTRFCAHKSPKYLQLKHRVLL